MNVYFVIIFIIFFISMVINMVTLNYLGIKYKKIINYRCLEYLLSSSYPFHVSFYLFQKDFPEKMKKIIFLK